MQLKRYEPEPEDTTLIMVCPACEGDMTEGEYKAGGICTECYFDALEVVS